ncbi:hypothetical protein L6164_011100 [Bauhinia variegata]|uniref:Uncharacterized protein n=1 Tax=Bauhinia variegata TaxID=167791 RepID=A0ACB9P5Y9_BAUVA|nr:hypothetical protein L6164_011100 [Bauhinia variegata]
MEEEKAAAYYDELTRKGEGAARFKQGLGFSGSSSNDDVPQRGSAFVSSSSFLSNFVKASSPSKVSEFEKQAQLQSIQNKLKKKPSSEESGSSRVAEKTHRDRDSGRPDSSREKQRERGRERHRDRDSDSSRERQRERDRESRRRSRSRERHRDRDSGRRKRRRSRSRSDSDGDRRKRGRGRSRSISPRERRSDKEQWRSEKNGTDIGDRRKVSKIGKEKNVAVDYGRLIEGYDKMSPAERVKAKMKLQLSETAEKDSLKVEGWERFEFNKDAPLDDEETEAAEDDATLVKHIGQSFRFSAVQARREEQIQAAHEEAMFGSTTTTLPPSINIDSEPETEGENNEKGTDKEDRVATSILSETLLAKHKGSWRDRVRKA